MVMIYKNVYYQKDIDLVIHLAGLSGVRDSLDNPSELLENKCNCNSKNI